MAGPRGGPEDQKDQDGCNPFQADSLKTQSFLGSSKSIFWLNRFPGCRSSVAGPLDSRNHKKNKSACEVGGIGSTGRRNFSLTD
ncbi:MAG: hypothetical protein A2600_05355 [Candidatus Lambdaproteobacteria bacterium RIFOXYD1_FULL_56_27]|uniref:Uncharacterized protein n=1 Tax=Candidatus Lambdaproteobacteria bacterium RIFOXYD2_FULL_56_26 TaxID=1817773 RepID=A0A1F6GXD0_9PROT|nr:MAG: hypothetical protein A2426_10565 [Candidatus Lambdaproteobacteria bacterium RIFOXYC1_FULL_56_13]OGH02729.1 MAG: hypothetical protein A2557_06280 [Candidatus Lambdaproteobacteria bacterium RIFOXYD2_FULL_56_26]OGH07795.1 MAG: hypothetical protein A2600_05355 [Candidatus Lambdaproteobacteria bacterium RIFOXYD1_FULL_56_27]